MARLIQHLVESPRTCSYLEDRDASLEHRIAVDATTQDLEALVLRGWRRFGPDTFRPACGACSECVPTRVPVDRFTPTRSQRTAARRCASLRAEVGVPRVDGERLALYRAWHATREAARGWSSSPLNARSYFMQFAFPHPAARELAYYDESDRLVGLGLCDETPLAWSAAYFFYHPDVARLSLGVANILRQIDIARVRNIPHVYLGYWVAQCPSMSYKGRYRPQERLVGWPSLDETPIWMPVE